jgi:2-amino-4-hydroxy-6-hydroxymethyldihydropteridine diphosphokinase
MDSECLHTVFVGLGSNLGDREQNLQSARSHLCACPDIELVACSAFKETVPWGVVNQPNFINAVAIIRTALPPHDLLATLKHAERALGRTPSDLRWGPRLIDLDILLYDDEVLESATLTIPHPRLTERIFIMEQIVELDKTARHPLLKRTFLSLLKESKMSLVNSVE